MRILGKDERVKIEDVVWNDKIQQFDLKKSDSPPLMIDDKGSNIGRNNVEIRCICTKVLLAVRSDKKESKVSLQINCRKMVLTCVCGNVHEIENQLWGDEIIK